jgi:HAE1 family hydrophobic/amphiphilic exporter-1
VLVSIPLAAGHVRGDGLQGVSLNVISMAGLALSVGMLVDNSIVVLENVFSRLQKGERVADAAIHGTGEMAMPIVASTLTTVAVFAPVLFVPGLAGQLFRDMSLTIVISLLSSLAVALTLVPLMASLMELHGGQNKFERLLGASPTGSTRSERYGQFLGSTLRHRKKLFVITAPVFVTARAEPAHGADFMPRATTALASP